MKQCLPFFATHLCISITEDKSDGCEEVALSRAIVANDDIVLRGKGLDHRLLLIAKPYVSKRYRILVPATNLLKPWMMICLINIAVVAGSGRVS